MSTEAQVALARGEDHLALAHEHWDIFRVINPSALIGYNKPMIQWRAIQEALPDVLARLRTGRRLTAPQMAERLGISRSQIVQWIRQGKVKPISEAGIDGGRHYLFEAPLGLHGRQRLVRGRESVPAPTRPRLR